MADARRATASLRREKAKVERHRSRKQADPAERMTITQWIAGGD